MKTETKTAYISIAALPVEQKHQLGSILAGTVAETGDYFIATTKYFPLFRDYFVQAGFLYLAQRLLAAMVVQDNGGHVPLEYYLGFNNCNVYRQGNLAARLETATTHPWTDESLIIRHLKFAHQEPTTVTEKKPTSQNGQIKRTKRNKLVSMTLNRGITATFANEDSKTGLLYLYDSLLEQLRAQMLVEAAFSPEKRARRLNNRTGN